MADDQLRGIPTDTTHMADRADSGPANGPAEATATGRVTGDVTGRSAGAQAVDAGPTMPGDDPGTDESPSSVTRSVDLDASPEVVWDAVADPERRRAWLDDPDATDRALRIDHADPGRSLTWTWWRPDDEAGASQVHVVLTELPGGSTRVAVTERLLAPTPVRFQARAAATATATPVGATAIWDRRLLGLELLVVLSGALVA